MKSNGFITMEDIDMIDNEDKYKNSNRKYLFKRIIFFSIVLILFISLLIIRLTVKFDPANSEFGKKINNLVKKQEN